MKSKIPEIFPIVEQIARIGIYETDIASGIWRGSENFIKIFGLETKEHYSVEEFQAIVHPDDLKRVMDYFEQCLASKTDFNCEYRCVSTTGQVIYVMSRSKIYYSPEGIPLRILGIKQDITESKHTEDRLSNLVENNKQKNEVLSVVAHDLQNPLAQLESLISLIQDPGSSDLPGLILLQQEICRSARRIIGDLIEIAELEDSNYILKTSPTNVNEIIESSIRRFESAAKAKQLSIKLRLSPNCEANLNADKFSRALDNLVSNAIKFTGIAKEIELISEVEANCLRVIVRDKGIGIGAEYMPSLFNKFSKANRRPGTNGEKSNGLGLSIVKNIVELHKGTIRAESQENVGTTFFIELPR